MRSFKTPHVLAAVLRRVRSKAVLFWRRTVLRREFIPCRRGALRVLFHSTVIVSATSIVRHALARGSDEAIVQDAGHVPKEIGRLIAWLPSDSESLIVDRVRRSFSETLETEPGEKGLPTPMFLLIKSCVEGDLAKELATRTVRLRVESAKGFKAPIDIGLASFLGVCVFVFDNPLPGRLLLDLPDEKYTQKQNEGTVSSVASSVDGQGIAPRCGIIRVAPDTLVFVSQADMLSAIVNKVRGADNGAPMAFPSSFEEWKHVSFRSDVWGIRHYDAENAPADLTSPLCPARPSRDPKAVGITISYMPRQGVVHARYLSAASGLSNYVDELCEKAELGLSLAAEDMNDHVLLCARSSKPELRLLIIYYLLGYGVYP